MLGDLPLETKDHVLKLGNAVEQDAAVGPCCGSGKHADRRRDRTVKGGAEGRLGADQRRGVGKTHAPARRSHGH